MEENEKLKRISDKVVEALYTTGITKTPGIRVDHDGDYIIHHFFPIVLDLPFIAQLKNEDPGKYLITLGQYAMGVGGYLVYCSDKYDKYICDFSSEEVKEIYGAMAETEPYDLLLQNMGISRGSDNEQCLDYIIRMGIKAAIEELGESFVEPINLVSLMNIFYYAGITVVLR